MIVPASSVTLLPENRSDPVALAAWIDMPLRLTGSGPRLKISTKSF
jgi:hypothetical protein